MENQLKQQQPILYQQLHNSLKHGKLLHAYLFDGEALDELKATALWLMAGFFCENPLAGDPCKKCFNCRRIFENEHPDVLQIAPSGTTIKVEQIRQLQEEFGKAGMESLKRGFIILDAEKMSISAANSLLKFLEEPQKDTLAILTTQALGQILPTIQSRLQILHLQPPAKEQLLSQLKERKIPEAFAEELVFLTDSEKKAIELWEDQWFNEASQEISKFVQALFKKDWHSFILVQSQLLPLFKDKKQQELAFSLIFFAIKKEKGPLLQKAFLTEIFLNEKLKWQRNVSFQNALEQGVLHSLKDKN